MIGRWLRLVRRSGVLAAAAGIALPLAPLQGRPAPQEVGSEVASADRQDVADVLYGRPNGAWMST